jgi:hypothetical protein
MSPATKDMPPPMRTSTGPAVYLDQPPLAYHPCTASNTTEENTKEDSQKEALQSVMEGLECVLKNSAYNFEVCFLSGYFFFIWGAIHFYSFVEIKKKLVH